MVSIICDAFRHAAERGRGFRPPHGGGHRDGNELGLTVVLGQDDCKARTVSGVEEEVVEAILDIMFAEVDPSMGGVRQPDLSEDTSKVSTKLH